MISFRYRTVFLCFDFFLFLTEHLSSLDMFKVANAKIPRWVLIDSLDRQELQYRHKSGFWGLWWRTLTQYNVKIDNLTIFFRFCCNDAVTSWRQPIRWRIYVLMQKFSKHHNASSWKFLFGLSTFVQKFGMFHILPSSILKFVCQWKYYCTVSKCAIRVVKTHFCVDIEAPDDPRIRLIPILEFWHWQPWTCQVMTSVPSDREKNQNKPKLFDIQTRSYQN